MYFADHLQRVTTLLNAVDPKDMAAVIEDILTPQEIVELGERIELLTQLKAGKTQRVIADEMGISVTTVSRWSRVLQFGKKGIQKYV